MSEKQMELMKKFLEKKKATQNSKQKFGMEKKIGSASKGKSKRNPGGANNKV